MRPTAWAWSNPSWLVAAMIALGVVIRLPTLAFPLVEAHAFRQTQTAMATLGYQQNGIDLLTTPLPTIGPPGQLPFELPLYQAIAAIAMNLGIPLEPAMRGTDLAFFAISAVVLVALLREYGMRSAVPVVLAAYLFSPLAIEWSRASTIEYAAVTAALGTLLATRRAETTGQARWWTLAIALGMLAALMKITTAVVWLVPGIVFGTRRRIPVSVCLTAAAAGVLWIRFGDGIKATGALTAGLTSQAIVDYGFGSVADRLDPVIWAILVWHLTSLGILALIGLVFVRRVGAAEDACRLWLLSGGAIAVALIVFPTLYARHAYYAVAISPAFAILVGASLTSALAARPKGYVTTVTAILVAATFAITFPTWSVAFFAADPDHELESARQVDEMSQPTDHVLVVGRDYSPAVLLYAHRNGIAVPANVGIDDLPADLVDGARIFDCGIDRGGDCVELSAPARGGS